MLYTTNLVVYVYHNVRRVLSGKGVKRSRMGGAQEGEQEKSPPLSIMRLRFVFEILSCSVKEIFFYIFDLMCISTVTTYFSFIGF